MYLIIIGAPRSGTNMLRDVLTRLPGFATWPCDEINYIWRHGNVGYPSDEFTPSHARADVRRYVRHQFEKMGSRTGANVLVEKTCANALRVSFVDAIVPEARYIHIYRNGLDVVDSAQRRWKATLDLPYLARKVRFVPPSDLPFYALRYAANRVHRLVSGSKRLAFWGPKLDDMRVLLQNHTLEEVCALQWRACVENAEAAFSEMPKNKVVQVSYERFVASPSTELKRIASHFQLEANDTDIEDAIGQVKKTSVGRGRKTLSPFQIDKLRPLIADTLERHGYSASA